MFNSISKSLRLAMPFLLAWGRSGLYIAPLKHVECLFLLFLQSSLVAHDDKKNYFFFHTSCISRKTSTYYIRNRMNQFFNNSISCCCFVHQTPLHKGFRSECSTAFLALSMSQLCNDNHKYISFQYTHAQLLQGTK